MRAHAHAEAEADTIAAIVDPPITEAASVAVAVTPEEPLPVAVPVPTVNSEHMMPASVAQADAAQAMPAIPGGGRSFEDAVVDLLRPMLRTWIDANMPVMVEKALRAENLANAPPLKPGALPASAPTQKPN